MDNVHLLNDRYEIKEILGRGGFATTYLAIDTETEQQCAVKCLSFRKIEEWKTWELFEREAKILKNLNHPRIPAYIDFFTIETEQDVEIYLVQEYVEGKSLAQLVQEGKHFSEQEVIRIARKLIRILEYLHSLSPPIVHRDIKPGNITLSSEDHTYLIDFGAVKDTMLSDYSKSTGVPTVVGTYGYMAIEQIEGRALPASDIYSLGMTLIYLLSHTEPTQMGKKGLQLDFRPHVNISDRFARILDKMIAPDWTKRYQSVSEVKTDFEKLLSGKSALRFPTPLKTLAAGIASFVLLGMFYLFWLTPPPPEPEVESVRIPVPVVSTPTPLPQPTAVKNETPKPDLQDYNLYPISGRILFDNQPISTFTDVEPEFSFFNQTSKQHETPDSIEYEDGEFEIQGLFAGHFYMSVEIDANPNNPNRYPGDFMKWEIEFDVPATSEIVVEMTKVIHLMQPQDNIRQMQWGASDCSNQAPYRSPLRFVWESLGEGVKYNYLVGTVDCIEHLYLAGSEVNEWTTDTEVTLNLPPNKENEKYAFHIFAEKDGRQIGRLYIHDEGPSNWNYDFQIIEDEGQKPPQPPQPQPGIQGRLFFDNRPITDFSTHAPTFWFRNEDTGKEQSARVRHENGTFYVYGLPVGNFGVSVNLDANMQNPWSYPGDFRVWKPFSIIEGENPELILNLQQIIRMTSPQDNGAVMELWGAECMEKISFRSPVTFRWEALGQDMYYDYQITRMACLNNYNSAGTVTGETITDTEITVNLPPSKDNECYGFHLYARKEGRRVGMLITHGASGYGWDYRFRVK